MAEVHFTAWLRQHVPDGPLHVPGGTVGDALEGVFTELRGSYQALWRRVDGRWLLDAQVFIPLSCKGSSYCDQRKG